MKFTAQAAAHLAALTATFDDSEIDILHTLTRLADQVRLAVPSYLGLSIAMTTANSHSEFTAMDDVDSKDDIRSSLSIPTSTIRASGSNRASSIAVVVYAATSGAFVDLAADLAWMTSRPLGEITLDQHLAGPPSSRSDADTESVINQAIGVLLGQGHTLLQARQSIDAQAVSDGVSRRVVATAILDNLDGPPSHPGPKAHF